MNDMAGTAVRATVERIGKVPRYNITVGVSDHEDANPAALQQAKIGLIIDALAGA